MKKKILITRQIPEIGMKLLRKEFQTIENKQDRILSKKELKEKSKNVDGIWCIIINRQNR